MIKKEASSCLKQLNIAIYADEGVDNFGLQAIRRYFKDKASLISANQLLQSGISSKLFVMPGGADVPYLKLLKGKGNEIIRNFVHSGGCYLGVCAGGYYASSSIVFAPGSRLEVKGDRELGFFPGKCIGPVNSNFEYGTHRTAVMAKIKFLFNGSEYYAYANGGGYFEENAASEVLATTEVNGKQVPIIIKLKYGKGRVVLTGVHIEYGWEVLANIAQEIKGLDGIKERLKAQESDLYKIMTGFIFE